MVFRRDMVAASSDDVPAVPDAGLADFDDFAAGLATTHEQVMAAYTAGTSDGDMLRRDKRDHPGYHENQGEACAGCSSTRHRPP